MSDQLKEPSTPPYGNFENRIDRVPGVCGGRPKIRGTRWAVEVMLDMLAGGESMDYLLKEFPELTTEDWRAALQYGAKAASGKTFIKPQHEDN
jgi:uncharacterized protein (DUF433 family)